MTLNSTPEIRPLPQQAGRPGGWRERLDLVGLAPLIAALGLLAGEIKRRFEK